VTRRYVRRARHTRERRTCPEEVLAHIINEIRVRRQARWNEADKMAIREEEAREQAELRGYILSGIVDELASIDVDAMAARPMRVKRKPIGGGTGGFAASKSTATMVAGKSPAERGMIRDSRPRIETAEGDVAPTVSLNRNT
jgi:hypothetical protein